jgi:hypothetical protein
VSFSRRSGEKTFKASGDVAQLGERLVRNEKVSGSIPLISTNFYDFEVTTARESQAGLCFFYIACQWRDGRDFKGIPEKGIGSKKVSSFCLRK